MDINCEETYDEGLIRFGNKGIFARPICIGRLGYQQFIDVRAKRHLESVERYATRRGKEKLYLSCTIQADSVSWKTEEKSDWRAPHCYHTDGECRDGRVIAIWDRGTQFKAARQWTRTIE